MNADWVAVSVRSRSLAQRRFGAGASRAIASQPDLEAGLSSLSTSVYGDRLAGCSNLAAAERATRDTVLWQLRVLAGWMPATGTRLARAVAGVYELDNIVAFSRSLADGSPSPAPYELGSLSTAWARVRSATSVEQLAEALGRSPWGTPAAAGTAALRDELTLVWLDRLAGVAKAARPWAESAAALIMARSALVDGVDPAPRIQRLARRLLGSRWERGMDLAALKAVLPSAARSALEGVTAPEHLWRSEAQLRARVEADGFRMLRSALPGPDVVLGGIAVLGIDAWRVRAGLAAAAAGLGTSEVLDVVA